MFKKMLLLILNFIYLDANLLIFKMQFQLIMTRFSILIETALNYVIK